MSNFPTRLEYNVGSDHSPGDPFGRYELMIEADGRARLVHQGRAWTARVNSETLATLWAALERGGFPDIPLVPPVAGATLCTVLAHVGDAKVGGHVAERAVKDLDGYNEAIPIFNSIMCQIGGDAVQGAQNTLPPVVSDVVCETN